MLEQWDGGMLGQWDNGMVGQWDGGTMGQWEVHTPRFSLSSFNHLHCDQWTVRGLGTRLGWNKVYIHSFTHSYNCQNGIYLSGISTAFLLCLIVSDPDHPPGFETVAEYRHTK